MDHDVLVLVAIVTLGVVGLVAILANIYATRERKHELAAALGPYLGIAESLYQRADAALVPYGDKLKPAHEVIVALGTLVDDPADFLCKLLPDTPEALIREALERARQLTDGKPIQLSE